MMGSGIFMVLRFGVVLKFDCFDVLLILVCLLGFMVFYSFDVSDGFVILEKSDRPPFLLLLVNMFLKFRILKFDCFDVLMILVCFAGFHRSC